MLRPETKRFFLKILPLGIISAVLSIIYSLLERGILGEHPIYPSTGNPYTFNLVVPTIISFFIGLLIGIIEVRYLSKFFIKNSFFIKISLKALIYFFIIVLAVFLITNLSTAFELGLSPFSSEVLTQSQVFFSAFAVWSILFYFTFGIVIGLFYIEISDNVGQNVLSNFFTGKYHHPVEEERVFLFLDMKSSTTIAEKLGHTKYFQLLRDYYNGLSDAIVKFDGDIYQYVGDEVVVTWKLKANEKNMECIDCFYAMKEALADKEERYMNKYGVAPTFKAGIHFGKVTTGEIGKIKKDIVFTGDVLNTTARIQGLCNSYGVELLLSKDLVETLDLKRSHNAQELGETELRGRYEKMSLFTIPTSNSQ